MVNAGRPLGNIEMGDSHRPQGAYVFIISRRRAELDKAVAEIGSNVTAVQGDVANPDDLDRLYQTVAAKKGKLDILFANAGIADPIPTPGG